MAAEHITRVQVLAADSYIRRPSHGVDWVAVGDAASAWDPLSGQGVERALRSGLRAAQAIGEALDHDESALDRYESEHARLHEAYCAQRHAYYESARRWRGLEFWRRRL